MSAGKRYSRAPCPLVHSLTFAPMANLVRGSPSAASPALFVLLSCLCLCFSLFYPSVSALIPLSPSSPCPFCSLFLYSVTPNDGYSGGSEVSMARAEQAMRSLFQDEGAQVRGKGREWCNDGLDDHTVVVMIQIMTQLTQWLYYLHVLAHRTLDVCLACHRLFSLSTPFNQPHSVNRH